MHASPHLAPCLPPVRARRSRVSIPHARAHMYHRLRESVRPRPPTTLWAWADRNRILSRKGSGEPGQWRTDRVPFTREIMDCLSTHSPVQRVVLKFAAQMAKTEIGLNWIGYTMDFAPGPMLVVVPTLEVRKRWVRQRLDPMLAETPILRTLFDARRRRDSGNAEDMKDFPGGMLVIGGANSPASLASMPMERVLCDELDRFPWEVGKEGDPLGLVEERTKTFPRRKILLVSTPTVAGESRIDDEYQASDQREYHVPCPHCGRYQILAWTQEDGERSLVRNPATGTVYYRCAHCQERIDERYKTAMLAAGIWKPRHPGRPVRGYWISGLYTPIGLGFTWSELLDKWDEARQDVAKLKRFVNTTLGETWIETGDSIDAMHLLGRLESYPDTWPRRLRTAFTDVQGDRLETTIIDWGTGEEAWTVDHHILPGDTSLPAVWDDLAAVLKEERVEFAGVDSGYRPDQVLAFCAARPWCYPTKGVTGPQRPIVEDELARRKRLRHRRKKGASIYPIGVDAAKTLLYSRLKLQDPGPGYVHFSLSPAFDDEYFAQLAAEKLVTRVRGNRAYSEWIQTRSRNESLDCWVGNLAVMRLSGRDLSAPPAKPDGEDGNKRFQVF